VQWGQSDVLEFDLKRTLRNGLIGALFGPVVCFSYLYHFLFKHLNKSVRIQEFNLT
jgi:hypothetical protein